MDVDGDGVRGPEEVIRDHALPDHKIRRAGLVPRVDNDRRLVTKPDTTHESV